MSALVGTVVIAVAGILLWVGALLIERRSGEGR